MVMMAERDSLMLYALYMMSQFGWEHLTTPRNSMCCSDAMKELKGKRERGGGGGG